MPPLIMVKEAWVDFVNTGHTLQKKSKVRAIAILSITLEVHYQVPGFLARMEKRRGEDFQISLPSKRKTPCKSKMITHTVKA